MNQTINSTFNRSDMLTTNSAVTKNDLQAELHDIDESIAREHKKQFVVMRRSHVNLINHGCWRKYK